MDEMEMVRKLYHLFYVIRKESVNMPESHREMHIERHNKHKIGGRDLMMLDAILKMREDGNLVKMSEISEYFQITPAAVSQLIRNFERKNWIERVVLDSDRRSVYIRVSEEAQKMIRDNEALMTAKLLDFITFLGEEDAQALIRIVQKCSVYMKNKKEEHCTKGDRSC